MSASAEVSHVFLWVEEKEPGERQLKRVLFNYTDYYNRIRTHLSLDKDAPEPRVSKPPDLGREVKFQRVGGLHHEYSRMAA